MNLHAGSECSDMLLDLVCYEILRGNLSPEMEGLLESHLEECPDCRRRVLDFGQTLSGAPEIRNFG
jgi:hypothetical protein